ncbi:hypothetical protein MAR_027203 [Mya arenaria]|uniref:PH domain-containing protein n=1 Tax=Mya arenaria TaxID=6604 RepID=A0ABY7ESS3_MYAAR|nr:uncharacterized protein LOC128244817 [Mya arenaria]WAR13023.1 hypothetical protein MAR_027203 [Mya arenaria]
MVGHTILKAGRLDVKSPSTSSFARGWRLPPWKTRSVEFVKEGDQLELRIYKEKSHDLVDTYLLNDITDVTMVASKTHAHAFELLSRGTSVLVLSGETELESRDWIWNFRRVFWPHAIPQTDDTEKLSLQLFPTGDSSRINLPAGIYSTRVSLVAIELNLVTRCDPGDRSCTPVEPFNTGPAVEKIRLPLTTLGPLRVFRKDADIHFTVETLPDFEYGVLTLEFMTSDGSEQTTHDVINVVKSALFQATSNLHDCISSSTWNLHKET